MNLSKLSKDNRGYVLPMATVLVVVLGISGAAFLQLDYLERLMALRSTGHLDAFYLASAGIERAREVCKPDATSGNASWTSTLNGSRAGAGYVSNPHAVLCPTPTLGCISPPFQNSTGDPLTTATAQKFPFFGDFDDGSYSVRISNNVAPGEVGTTDNDHIITIHALGNVRGDQKVITADFISTGDLDLMNCQGAVTDICPDANGGVNILSLPDHAPSSSPNLPTLNPPLTPAIPQSYYRIPANFTFISPAKRFQQNIISAASISNDGYYHTAGNISLGITASNVVIFSEGTIDVSNGTDLTNAILIGVTGVTFNGQGIVRAPVPTATTPNYPVIISNGNVTQGSGNTEIFGSIYTTGTINLNPGDSQGVLIGGNIQVQGASSSYIDANNPLYYNLMPGFNYPADKIKAVSIPGTWREA